MKKESEPITASVDLEAYFQRIGFMGERAPTLTTLRAIYTLHPQSIAFENLNPLLRIPVHLDIGSVQQKLERGGREDIVLSKTCFCFTFCRH